jgi:hypothetical protein
VASAGASWANYGPPLITYRPTSPPARRCRAFSKAGMAGMFRRGLRQPPQAFGVAVRRDAMYPDARSVSTRQAQR